MTDDEYATDTGCTAVECQGSCRHCGAGPDEPCYRECDGPRDLEPSSSTNGGA